MDLIAQKALEISARYRFSSFEVAAQAMDEPTNNGYPSCENHEDEAFIEKLNNLEYVDYLMTSNI